MNLTDLSAGSYVVFAIDTTSCTNSDTIIVDMIVPTFEESLANQIRVFPNPTSGKFTLDVDLVGENEVSIGIVDLTGKMILNTKNSGLSNTVIEMDLSEFSNGVYYLKIELEGEVVMKKIVLER